jgi:hypothetical protein
VLSDRLGVLAQWSLQGGRYVAVANGRNLADSRGVRRDGDVLQMGLTRTEISAVYRLLTSLLERVDRGEITAGPAPAT